MREPGRLHSVNQTASVLIGLPTSIAGISLNQCEVIEAQRGQEDK